MDPLLPQMNDIRSAYIEERKDLCSGRGVQRPDLQRSIGSDGLSRAEQFFRITQQKTDAPAKSAATRSIGVVQSIRSMTPQLIKALFKLK